MAGFLLPKGSVAALLLKERAAGSTYGCSGFRLADRKTLHCGNKSQGRPIMARRELRHRHVATAVPKL
jgi:hypothetical protein